MLTKWTKEKANKADTMHKDPLNDSNEQTGYANSDDISGERKVNAILQGSRVKGDITVTCDLVLSGDVEGNITAREDSNITIKGSCRGNIETGRGNVDIRGTLQSGNISTGGNVSISGKFTGGEVKAGGKIYVNCEFTGRLEGNEIEVGPRAHIRGELFYREYITISRGAKVEVHLCCVPGEKKLEKKTPEQRVADIKPPVSELTGVK